MPNGPTDQEKKEKEGNFGIEKPAGAGPALPEIKPEIIRPPEAEKVPEKMPEAPEIEEEAKEAEISAITPTAPPFPPTAPPKSEILVSIERILEEDLGEIYFKMPPHLQQEFKIKGEETASKIEQLFKQAKATARKILKLLREWLKIIPGVNKFFLEQEAKIKTDRLMKLKKWTQKSNPKS